VPKIQFKITLCDAPSCIQKQSKQIRQALDKELEKQGLKEKVSIHLSG